MASADIGRPFQVGQSPAGSATHSREVLAALIASHRSQLGLPGVQLARPGWRLSGGWLQSERAIVVVAAPERADAVRAALPAAIEGVPVDVRAANPLQALRHADPRIYAALAAGPRQEYEVPVFSGEIRFGDAGRMDAAGTDEAALLAARPRKPEIDYTRPAGVTVGDIEEEMSLTLHASPDAGWLVLRDFLTTAPGDLVVGMYDFTAPHIEGALLQGLGADGGGLTITLDHPPGKAARSRPSTRRRATSVRSAGG